MRCCARCNATATTSRSWSTSTAAPLASSPSRTCWRRSSARSPTSTTLDTQAPIEPLADGSYRVSARLPVEDLGEVFDVELPDDDVETVGGLLAQLLGRVPLPGSEATSRAACTCSANTARTGADGRGCRPCWSAGWTRRTTSPRTAIRQLSGPRSAPGRTNSGSTSGAAQGRDRGATGRPAKSERPQRNGATASAGAEIGSAVNRTNPRTERDHAR